IFSQSFRETENFPVLVDLASQAKAYLSSGECFPSSASRHWFPDPRVKRPPRVSTRYFSWASAIFCFGVLLILFSLHVDAGEYDVPLAQIVCFACQRVGPPDDLPSRLQRFSVAVTFRPVPGLGGVDPHPGVILSVGVKGQGDPFPRRGAEPRGDGGRWLLSRRRGGVGALEENTHHHPQTR